MDLKLLSWFDEQDVSFAMEVCERTAADKKGGHLARLVNTGGLLLREKAQCADEDAEFFEDVAKHRFFNTNNLWINLPKLKAKMKESDGVLPLPVMRNAKSVDPRDGQSTPVFQLETAMGAAIECFDDAEAIVIPRSRFAPVKTTGDLLALMSDAYETTADHRMVLRPERHGKPPIIKLDGCYKFVDQLNELVPDGPPSLLHCSKLEVNGKIRIARGVVFKGKVKVTNTGDDLAVLDSGTYEDTDLAP